MKLLRFFLLKFSISCFRFYIQVVDLPNFVRRVKNIIKKTPTAFPWRGIRITFSGVSRLLLSPSYGQESAVIGFRMLNRKDPFNEPSGSLAGYQTIVQTLVSQLVNFFGLL